MYNDIERQIVWFPSKRIVKLISLTIQCLSCPYSAPGETYRVAHLNMTNHNKLCGGWDPSGGQCGRTTALCASTVFPSNSCTYSQSYTMYIPLTPLLTKRYDYPF